MGTTTKTEIDSDDDNDDNNCDNIDNDDGDERTTHKNHDYNQNNRYTLWRNYRGSSYSRAVGPGRVRGARPDQD